MVGEKREMETRKEREGEEGEERRVTRAQERGERNGQEHGIKTGNVHVHIRHIYTCTRICMYTSYSNHVVPKTECSTLYSCFWLVGHHQQGVAQTDYQPLGFIGPRCTEELWCLWCMCTRT